MGESQSVSDPLGSRPLETGRTFPGRHALREQEHLWVEFLAMGNNVVASLEKSLTALCDGRIDVVPEVKELERDSDREEVRIERNCLRILALFEPVASDLRRMATILKVSRDWERIADLAARVARRARKLISVWEGVVTVPETLKELGISVLNQTRASYEALSGAGLAGRPAGDRGRSRDQSTVSAVPPGDERLATSRRQPTRCLAAVPECWAPFRANRRPRHRHCPVGCLSRRRDNHPASRRHTRRDGMSDRDCFGTTRASSRERATNAHRYAPVWHF